MTLRRKEACHQSIHLEKTFLDVAIRIGGRSSDEDKNLDGNRLRHGLNHIVKLGLTARNSLQAELRFRLDQPCFGVIWTERREFRSNGHEQRELLELSRPLQ